MRINENDARWRRAKRTGWVFLGAIAAIYAVGYAIIARVIWKLL